MFSWIMKKIIFWLWAGWVASYLQISLSAQVNGGPDATPDLWKQPFSAVRASGGYPGNVIFLAGIAVSNAYYRTIICIYCPFRSDRWQLFLNLILGAFTVCSRMAFGGDDRWQSNQILMFLNIIMSTVMVLMLGTYQRQFIWIYIFSMGANMSNIWCHFVFREYWFCVCGLVQAFLYRVQGHGHITLQSMCNVWIDEMKYGGYWNFVVFHFFFFYFASKNTASQWDPENARQIVLTHGLLWQRRL